MAITADNKVEKARPFFPQRRCGHFPPDTAWGKKKGTCGLHKDVYQSNPQQTDISCTPSDQADFVIMGADELQGSDRMDIQNQLNLSFKEIQALAQESRCPFVSRNQSQRRQKGSWLKEAIVYGWKTRIFRNRS